ncbi:FIST N-terminal domain-containing protein [Halarcobacter sp.]|uniref:FIST signal transduction protein n=1 Tax=Halarcobacter sp. TaxID=2321133 RepID=UPI002AA81AA5|nr:FIST N-terminal domain-containing protein [Halarcobacter sp.]
MQTQSYFYEENNWNAPFDESLDSENTLIICFGSTRFEDIKDGFENLISTYKKSKIIGCSTAGEIYDDLVYESSLSVVIMKFEKSIIKICSEKCINSENSFEVGEKICNNLFNEELKSIFVLSDGLNINGSQLTKGFNKVSKNTIITGGLAGDGADFKKTWVLVDNKPVSNYITAVGLYGDNIHTAYANGGGWKKFGIDRMVTEAKNNILYKLDYEPALQVYKKYLGDKSENLPASGLLYPLMIKEEGYKESKVRTILGINKQEQSITFAGDIPNGSEVMFMKATFDELAQGAKEAGDKLQRFDYKNKNATCIVVSCIGRKLIMGQKIEEELEAIKDILDNKINLIGYYSYGEISPLNDGTCDLHNQTVTLTLFWET